MSNYTKTTDFAAKDALLTGNPSKLVKGTEINVEFSNIQTAVNSKLDSSGVTAFAATLLDDVNAATARATLGAAASGANTDITSMTGLSNGGIPVAKVSGAAVAGALGSSGITGAAASGANTDITSLGAVASMNGGQLAGLRNAVINGNGLEQQRVAPTLTAALQYGAADRHLIGVTGGTGVSGTVNVVASAGFSYGIGYGAVAASWTAGAFIHKHRIEGANTRQFNNKTVTVSGVLYQDTGGTRNFTVSLGKPTSTLDTFSAVTNLSTSAAKPVLTGVATPFSQTFTLGASDASLGLEILITDNATNSVVTKNYLVGDLQLEIGSVATPFEQRPYGMELALCQRYYQRNIAAYSGNATSGVQYGAAVSFPVAMRAAPTGAFVSSVVAANFPATAGVFTVAPTAEGYMYEKVSSVSPTGRYMDVLSFSIEL